MLHDMPPFILASLGVGFVSIHVRYICTSMSLSSFNGSLHLCWIDNIRDWLGTDPTYLEKGFSYSDWRQQYNYVAGAIVGIVGVLYAVLEFIPSIEPPSNMREADQGWGAEQV